MTTRYTSLVIGMSLVIAALGANTAQAQAGRASSSSSSSSSSADATTPTQFVFGTTSYLETKRAAPAVSSSLEAAPDDATALSAAGKSGDKDQVRALLQKHGFTAEQLAACDVEVHTIVSPRDAASGLPTGKRMHKPMMSSGQVGGDTGADPAPASKIKITITVSIKPPKITITIYL